MGSESRYLRGELRRDAATAGRGRRDGRHGRTPFLAIAALLFTLIALAGAASAAGGIQLEVCQDDEVAQEPECETQEIGQRPSPKPPSKPSGGGSGGGGEVHDFTISPGGRVTEESSSGGGRQDVEIKLPKPGKPQAPIEVQVPGGGSGGGKDHDRPPTVNAPNTGGTGLAAVSTTGGAGVPGSSSPFDYVSDDQALASYAIPPFLLPMYVSAGQAYDIPWNLLASINRIETDFGRLGACAVSSAGATGWMQFMPSTWDAYGVDASGDGVADPCNPVDAIYAAARYLDASGGSSDLRGAVFAYNHADWYVDEVMTTAGVYGSLPAGLVAETGSLAFGLFPVRGEVLYGDDYREAQQSGEQPEGVEVFPRSEASAIATQDVKVDEVILDRAAARALRRSGEFRAQRDAGSSPWLDAAASVARSAVMVAPLAPALEELAGLPTAAALVVAAQAGAVASTDRGSGNKGGASAGPKSRASDSGGGEQPGETRGRSGGRGKDRGGNDNVEDSGRATKEERGAWDGNGNSGGPAWLPNGYRIGTSVGVIVEDAARNRYRYEGLAKLRDAIRPGEKLRGGALIGPLRSGKKQPMMFATRAAGGARVDPRPLLDGYRLQELADYYNAVEPLGGNPFLPEEGASPVGSISGTQGELARRVLDDSGIDIYECGREDIARGIVDRRILGALLYLRKAGMTLTVTSLRCGHGYYTAGGSVSAHSYGAAVDIAAFNGQPVIGNQGPGSLTEQAIKTLMQLDGEAQPAQLISLMDLGGSSFALGDHADHLHVGYNFDASLGLGRSGETAKSVVFGSASGPAGLPALDAADASKADEKRLSERLAQIKNPDVRDDVGPNGIQIEGEKGSESGAAGRLAAKEFPLTVSPTSAGARLVDVDVVSEDRSYAIGTVDGAAEGWKREQTVALAEAAGIWRVIGPPRDSRGDLADPALRALAVGPDGVGYAVGERGTVVALRGEKRPLVLESPGKKTLTDVALPADGEGPAAAIGEDGTTLRLSGDKVEVDRAARGKPELAAVTPSAATILAVGEDAGGEPALLERTRDGWQPQDLGFRVAADTAVSLTSAAAEGAEVWIGGAISSAGGSGAGAELPFLAHRSAAGWTTFCSGSPALANVRELGTPSHADSCDRGFPLDVGETGPISAVANTDDGVVLSTGRGLRLLEGTDFRLIPGAPARTTRLDLEVGGSGLALARDGRMARIEPNKRDGTELPLGAVASLPQGSGPPAPIAVSPGGDRALVFAGGASSVQADGSWNEAPDTSLAIRDAGFLSDSAWAIDESGSLLTWDGAGEDWRVLGLDEDAAKARAALARSVGSDALAPGASGADDGFQALEFGSELEGYAVGGNGLIARFLKDEWTTEDSPSTATLRDVTVGAEGVVAVGDEGTLLEREDDGWMQALEARSLVEGQDFTAAETLADGTMLAVAGGSVIQRPPDAEAWQPSELTPLGVPVSQLVAYRDASENLHAITLVGEERPVLLEGTLDGWRPIALPEGMTASSFTGEPGSERIWVSGAKHGKPVVTTIDLASGKAAEPNAEGDEQGPSGGEQAADGDEQAAKGDEQGARKGKPDRSGGDSGKHADRGHAGGHGWGKIAAEAGRK